MRNYSESDEGDMQASESDVLAIIQARLSSVRFPRKVLAELEGLPLIEFMIQRVKEAKTIDKIVLAVPESDLESELRGVAVRQGIEIVGGSAHDVLERFATVVRNRPEGVVVRLTADCPLVDPEVIDQLVERFIDSDLDYLRTGASFPDGLDVEVTKRELLILANENATSAGDREHVTPWIAGSPTLQRDVVEYRTDLTQLRLTVDEPVDLQVVRSLLEVLPAQQRNLSGIEQWCALRPDLLAANSHLKRDEGATQTDAQKLWQRAKRVIPGGTSLLSKRPDMYLPDRWPTYFTEAHGCVVTSLDGIQYLDMGMMGVGTSILGFGDPRVDEAVSRVVKQGVVSTLNCPEEVLLAERLVELHPWAAQARFARSGGEACAMAVRIARAASGKDRVAICGYHGWHDWYLAANLSSDGSLDGHLLPGLSTRGVPRVLEGSATTFGFNDIAGLQEIVSHGDVGVIIMEVERSSEPAPGFLEGVRDLATQNGIVLIFDESTSGFRKVLGGHHLTVGVDPDLAIFGKTLGNGYAITAVLGRDHIMDVARDLFLSSTFWTERIGPAAALASLAAMEADEAPARIDALGASYRQLLSDALESDDFEVRFGGLPALTSIALSTNPNPVEFKTLLVRDMLCRSYLAGPSLYAALPHEEHVDAFVANLAEVLRDIAKKSPSELRLALGDQPAATGGFARLA
jgi:glutamate-1-semialdehyde 2,1-aminomutase